MIQTQLITDTLEEHFQDQLNTFLKTLNGKTKKLVEIQYNHTTPDSGRRRYSALVFYETDTPARILDPQAQSKRTNASVNVQNICEDILQGKATLSSDTINFILNHREQFPEPVVEYAHSISKQMSK